jgi:hypothetical protein
MDEPQRTPTRSATASAFAAAPPPPREDDDRLRNVPQDDDERFIVGLVLTYYRRHPQRARGRLLDLLGEVLTPAPAAPPRPGAKAPSAADDSDLWRKTQAAIAPLKKKR